MTNRLPTPPKPLAIGARVAFRQSHCSFYHQGLRTGTVERVGQSYRALALELEARGLPPLDVAPWEDPDHPDFCPAFGEGWVLVLVDPSPNTGGLRVSCPFAVRPEFLEVIAGSGDGPLN